jgi:hypothetical protein
MKKQRKKRFDIGSLYRGKKQPVSALIKRSKKIKQKFKKGEWKPWNSGKKLSKEHKQKLKESNIKTWKNISLRKKVDRIVTRWWREHPNVKKRVSEKIKKYYIENPKAFEKFLSGGKNPFKKKIKTKFGYKVRSKGEKEIADFLFDSKINAIYEKYTLFLDDWLCTPDFYLPKFNVFIEFYGGHPSSWKKKVIKNKIYKKCNLPFIAITPSELISLNKWLVSPAKKIKNKDYSWKKVVVSQNL